ncbi:glutathione peroxidase [Ferrovibrio xuzhouensis]|uniref:Glutathione peroxidase n=1 Tax=Ferrovibrio xuzhouensis TaxID=1576914 RepID=A0ABV7VAQ8_9PROT
MPLPDPVRPFRARVTLSRRRSLAWLAGAALLPAAARAATKRPATTRTGMTAYDFSFTGIDGKPLPMTQFRGKAVLLVNTASQCGFTPQYTDLQKVWNTYRDRGFVVLGVPSNDFGGQEPGSESQIKEFCEVNFSVDFPLTDKQHVIGPQAHPLYKWIGAELGEDALPKWNFHKYLIAPDGTLAQVFPTPVKPTDLKVTAAIEAELKKAKGA